MIYKSRSQTRISRSARDVLLPIHSRNRDYDLVFEQGSSLSFAISFELEVLGMKISPVGKDFWRSHRYLKPPMLEYALSQPD